MWRHFGTPNQTGLDSKQDNPLYGEQWQGKSRPSNVRNTNLKPPTLGQILRTVLLTATGTMERGWRLCSHRHFEPGRCHLGNARRAAPCLARNSGCEIA